jgi:pyrimidine-nucleoside phosphorylase
VNVPFSAVRAILRKREGDEHPAGEIEEMIGGFVDGKVADYQMTAWLMTIFFRGMNGSETARLTRAMLGSGRLLPKWSGGAPVVDKHSTGGVGDKVSLILAPIAAACGLRVPMISGRALGHTGGTLDKLEAIPGYQIRLDPGRFHSIVEQVGCSIAGASDDIVPADRRIYALRDVSGIVESPPLIVSSILSKKAAARLNGLVLDVKVGSGGFMPERSAARRLAELLVAAGTGLGIRVEAILTWMGDPLGRTVGNALEVVESIRFLRGEDVAADLEEVTLALAHAMLRVAGESDGERIRSRVQDAWRSGRALEKLAAMIDAHGGDPQVTEDPHRLAAADRVYPVTSSQAGWVAGADARAVGELVIDLGGGRRRVTDPVDPRVGVVFFAGHGTRVEPGTKLAEIHLREDTDPAPFEQRLRSAFRFVTTRPRPRVIILDSLDGQTAGR